MITAPLLSLFVLPALYLLWRKGPLEGRREQVADTAASVEQPAPAPGA
jgi:hypothetical protein